MYAQFYNEFHFQKSGPAKTGPARLAPMPVLISIHSIHGKVVVTFWCYLTLKTVVMLEVGHNNCMTVFTIYANLMNVMLWKNHAVGAA